MEIFHFVLACGLLRTGIADNVDSFSRHHVAVWFNPHISEDDTIITQDVNGLFPMISKISTRFDKIMVGTASHYLDSSVPVIVATYNKLYRLHQPPLEVLLTFGEKFTNASTRNDFIHAKRVADEANQVYPGTVKWFYLYVDGFESKNVEEVKTNMMHFQNLIKNAGYMLGIIMPGRNCEQSVYIASISPFVGEIVFSWWPESAADDPDFEAARIENEFNQCSQMINAQNQDVSIGLLTGWINGSTTDNDQNDLNLVTFWEKINDWAVKSGRFVVLCEAFDNHYEGNLSKQAGWWRLVENEYHHSSEFFFEEKRTAVNVNARRVFDKENVDVDTDVKPVVVEFSLWPAVVWIVLLLFICFEATGILWKLAPDITTSPQKPYKRRRLKQYREMALQDIGEGYYGNFLDQRKKTYKKDPKLSNAKKTGLCLHE